MTTNLLSDGPLATRGAAAPLLGWIKSTSLSLVAWSRAGLRSPSLHLPLAVCFAINAASGAATLAVAQSQPAVSHPAAHIDIDTLTAESDFTVFMHRGVPEAVRRAALRRLWVLMQLHVSCYELCYEPEPAATGFGRIASEKHLAPQNERYASHDPSR